MKNKTTNIIAAVLLAIIFFSAVLSMKDDAATFDELAHIPAGYSYLSQQDYRLNPEHPPLVKDLAAIPLMFLNLNFPTDHDGWTQPDGPAWWLQFDVGTQFLYHSGNNPDQIVFWSRVPMILLLMLLGWFVFRWTRKLAGNKAALFVLVLFSFSPTLLAHGRYVTTDIGATLGVVLSTYYWLNFLKKPSKKTIILAGLALGIAMLLKFSAILLLPFFAIITLVHACLRHKGFGNVVKSILKYAGLALIVGIIGAILIWPVYQAHIGNYPAERQVRDTVADLSPDQLGPLVKLTIWMADKPILRPYAEYMLGLLMATQRTIGGNSTYFLGMLSASAWWFYFPVIYLLKVPLALHILTLMSLLLAVLLIKKPFWKETKKRVSKWIYEHFTEFSMLVFLFIYWATSMTRNLNIGVRHILPTFPFVYILIAIAIIKGVKMIKKPSLKKSVSTFVLLLLVWYAGSSILVWPSYLAYYNELAGGPENGYKYATDSNLDWGQDLKRLAKWVDDYNYCASLKCDTASGSGCPSGCYTIADPSPQYGKTINTIYLDYFGGGDATYYLGDKYKSWQGTWSSQELPKNSYLAVSANALQGGRAEAHGGFESSTTHYKWLDQYEPIARIGYSIFIYYIE